MRTDYQEIKVRKKLREKYFEDPKYNQLSHIIDSTFSRDTYGGRRDNLAVVSCIVGWEIMANHNLTVDKLLAHQVATIKSDDYYRDKNPYLISAILGFSIMTVIFIGSAFRASYIDEHVRDYASVRKENGTIVIDSHSMFVENKTLPIKQQFGETIIVEYNDVDYVLYEYQLK